MGLQRTCLVSHESGISKKNRTHQAISPISIPIKSFLHTHLMIEQSKKCIKNSCLLARRRSINVISLSLNEKKVSYVTSWNSASPEHHCANPTDRIQAATRSRTKPTTFTAKIILFTSPKYLKNEDQIKL